MIKGWLTEGRGSIGFRIGDAAEIGKTGIGVEIGVESDFSSGLGWINIAFDFTLRYFSSEDLRLLPCLLFRSLLLFNDGLQLASHLTGRESTQFSLKVLQCSCVMDNGGPARILISIPSIHLR
jgi:hypothetical protein